MPPAGPSQGANPRLDRTLGAYLPARCRARSGHRLSARGAAMVGPLAQAGRRARRCAHCLARRLADLAAQLPPPPHPTPPHPPAQPRTLDCRSRLAQPERADADLVSGPGNTGRCAPANCQHHGLHTAGTRHRRRRVDGHPRAPQIPLPSTTRVCTRQGHATAAGEWMGPGVPGESPADQRLDDGWATVFDSAPLSAPLVILGMPELELELESDKPVAHLCARLSEVLPDGAVPRCSYAVFTLTQRDGAATPTPLEPQRRYTVRIALDACAHECAAGSHIRVALATTYWPLVWPAPEHATLTVQSGASALHLPVRKVGHEIAVAPFAAPERGPATPVEVLRNSSIERSATYDLARDEWTYVTESLGGLFGEGVLRLTEIDTSVEHNLRRQLTVRGKDPLSARYTITQSYRMGRPGWEIDIETALHMRADATHFHLDGTLTARENGSEVRQRRWQETLPRLLL